MSDRCGSSTSGLRGWGPRRERNVEKSRGDESWYRGETPSVIKRENLGESETNCWRNSRRGWGSTYARGRAIRRGKKSIRSKLRALMSIVESTKGATDARLRNCLANYSPSSPHAPEKIYSNQRASPRYFFQGERWKTSEEKKTTQFLGSCFAGSLREVPWPRDKDRRVVVKPQLSNTLVSPFLSFFLVFVGDQSRVRIREKGTDKLEKHEREIDERERKRERERENERQWEWARECECAIAINY